MRRKRLFGGAVLLAICLVVGCAAPGSTRKRAPRPLPSSEAELLEFFDLPPGSPVTYKSVDGTDLTFDQFRSQMPDQKLKFEIARSRTSGKVVLQLQPRESPPKQYPERLPPLDLTDLQGRRIRDADLNGRPALLSVFFDDGIYYKSQVPVLNAFAREHPEYRFLAVTFGTVDEARSFADKVRFEWPVAANARAFIDALGIDSYPTNLLISADGRVIGGHGYFDPNKSRGLRELERWIEESISVKPKGGS